MAEPDRTLYLVKADDRLHSTCRCAQGLAGFPIQADCPWCGCGWLFTCTRCGKPFTFARAEWIPVDLEAIARLNLGLLDRLSPGTSPTPEAIHG